MTRGTPRAKCVALGLLAQLGLATGCKGATRAGQDDDGAARNAARPTSAPLIPASASLPGEFLPAKDPVPHPAPPAPEPTWLGFEAYPGVELLCDEHVTAAPGGKVREIHWASYGSESPHYRITSYYKRHDAGAPELDRDEATFALGRHQRLSVIRLPTTQPFPRCERAPKPKHKAVIVVSRAVPR
ncbi:MAG: hypothetical protein IPF92_06650 [Myxococcales bacterium]|nr:hypothetical protein [Myxococcales bacterium]